MPERPADGRGMETYAQEQYGSGEPRKSLHFEVFLVAVGLMIIMLALMRAIEDPESLKLLQCLGPAELIGLEPDRYPAWCG